MKQIIIICFLLFKCTNLIFAKNIILLNNDFNSNSQLIQIKNMLENNELLMNNYKFKQASSIRLASINDIKTSEVKYYLLFLNSSTDYSIEIFQIFINNKSIKIIENYNMSKSDYISLEQYHTPVNIHCPDDSVEALVGSPIYSDGDDNKGAIFGAIKLFKEHGYKVVSLNDEQATINNYLNYLSCPNIKAVYHIGHGSNYSIELYDGLLPPIYIDKYFANKLNKVTILFNSCSAFSDLKPSLTNSLINNANVQKYISGRTLLSRNVSPSATSNCMLPLIIDQSPISSSVLACNTLYDPIDIFDVGGKGSNYLEPPLTSK